MAKVPRSMCKRWSSVAMALGMLAGRLVLSADEPAGQSQSPVGVAAQLTQLVLPGSELEAKPIEDRKTPIVVRILASYRHGSDYRYDLEFYGLEPGTYDLRDYLQRKDRSTIESVPSLPITIETRLPAGQIVPSPAQTSPLKGIGGYRLLIYGCGGLWLAGAAWLLFGGRRQALEHVESAKEKSLAELLRLLVAKAMAGNLAPSGQAELERLLLCYWRRRLGLEQTDPVTALTEIRNHPVAGDLLRQVEDWLHRPDAAGEVDLAKVLAPYQDLKEIVEPDGSSSGELSPAVSHTVAASQGA